MNESVDAAFGRRDRSRVLGAMSVIFSHMKFDIGGFEWYEYH